MADNTNQSDGRREPTHALNVEDLLISHDEAWGRAPTPKFVDACDNLRQYGVYLDSGATTSHPVPCNSWDHQPCAEKHAVEELGVFVDLLAGTEVAFHARVADAEFKSSRLSDRRKYWADREGRVWYRWYRRVDGEV